MYLKKLLLYEAVDEVLYTYRKVGCIKLDIK